jgi:hypothetical protein
VESAMIALTGSASYSSCGQPLFSLPVFSAAKRTTSPISPQ